ncbi:MAG: hypothetical protein CVU12_03940 [Bacteroidetes bacterium HGW-Bacteroidetes-7]|jgi:hypothetical protein|nr:MAG: hypothetical protein CVU12_03940 [Bacteroidetes bacterium HGW-Bacteroidetes-7]
MASFNFPQYITRAAKYMVYLVVVFILVIGVFALITKQSFNFSSLFREGTEVQIIIFLLALSFIYPIFGFSKKRVYLNKTFAQDREKITDVFTRNNFVQDNEGPDYVTFRHKSAFMRLMRMFEDKITVNYSDNPIALEGMRKDVYRIARMIEYAVRDDRNDG